MRNSIAPHPSLWGVCLIKGESVIMRRKRVQKKRDHYKYIYKIKKKMIHGGITTELVEREAASAEVARRTYCSSGSSHNKRSC